jgi:hypothetical protein
MPRSCRHCGSPNVRYDTCPANPHAVNIHLFDHVNWYSAGHTRKVCESDYFAIGDRLVGDHMAWGEKSKVYGVIQGVVKGTGRFRVRLMEGGDWTKPTEQSCLARVHKSDDVLFSACSKAPSDVYTYYKRLCDVPNTL